MTRLPVSRREVRRIYADLAEDVSVRERRLGEDLPVDTTADIPARLRETIDKWKRGQKSLRTVPVCNVYARHCDGTVADSMKRTLTGLDATINMLDDIIDTQGLTKRSKVALTLNVAFSSVLMVEGCPPDARAEINDVLLEYFTAVFQIPLVERELLERMTRASSPGERLDAATSFYAYRSRDIDAFARLPATTRDMDPAVEERLLEDLRSYRGRRLIFKDIRDVERDLADGDTTPVIYFLRTCDGTEEIVDVIRDLHSRFTYSGAGRRSYGDVLEELEDAPDDLHAAIRDTRETIFGTAV